jgi:hypothetical protein
MSSNASSSPHISSDGDTLAASDLFIHQHQLIADAAAAIPHAFDRCTYALGALRQPVYLCLTCTPPSSTPDADLAGVCAACSVACHAEHEQVELFGKRNFTCDCPTTKYERPCCLNQGANAGVGRERKMPGNAGNIYGQNYRGMFCRCGRPYDPEKEKETMIQCLACEVCSSFYELSFPVYLTVIPLGLVSRVVPQPLRTASFAGFNATPDWCPISGSFPAHRSRSSSTPALCVLCSPQSSYRLIYRVRLTRQAHAQRRRFRAGNGYRFWLRSVLLRP